jgi:hypothetical protein
MTQMLDQQALFDALRRERPNFHSRHDGVTATETAAHNWSLNPNVMEWLFSTLHPGLQTLETGCGHSTVMFAIRGCRHIVISPFPEEHQCINDWCTDHDVTVDKIAYHGGRSEHVLPALEPVPLNLVLIDGDHAVPLPFIDYFYVADSVVKDGLLVVDDCQLPSVRQLSDFLDTEKPRWALESEIDRTRIYRKLVDGRVTGLLWRQQPISASAIPKKPSLITRGIRKIWRILRLSE